MAARGDNNFTRYVYMGEEGEIIPRGATHIIVHEDVTIILPSAFRAHPNIIEVICHENVEKIEYAAFFSCRSLRRVIMPGVKIFKGEIFCCCTALEDVECGKLEIIGDGAFNQCSSLRCINLPSARIIELAAFGGCKALIHATFGSKLEQIDGMAFCNCTSLEQITIPLKDGMIYEDNTFVGCKNLNHVDLIGEEFLLETVAALQMEEWRNSMNEEIRSINQILSTAHAGWHLGEDWDEGQKAQAIRTWIRSVLRNIIGYKAHHQRLLSEAATTLQLALSHDTVSDNVLPFLDLPPHTFELEDY